MESNNSDEMSDLTDPEGKEDNMEGGNTEENSDSNDDQSAMETNVDLIEALR